LPQEGLFHVALATASPLLPYMEDMAPQWLKQVSNCLPLFETPQANPLTAIMDWQYPWSAASKTAVKWTVTGLQAKEQLPLGAPGGSLGEAAESNHAREKGIIIHKLLELTDLRQGHTLEAFKNTLKSLVEEGICPGELAQEIDLAMLADFMDSPLGQRVRSSSEQYRELSFTLLIPADTVNPALSEEEILLQGTIDLAFWEEDGWVLVDYKLSHTKSSKEEDLKEEVSQRYGWQLSCYRRALTEIWKKPVKECHVYFLPDRRDVPILFSKQSE